MTTGPSLKLLVVLSIPDALVVPGEGVFSVITIRLTVVVVASVSDSVVCVVLAPIVLHVPSLCLVVPALHLHDPPSHTS